MDKASMEQQRLSVGRKQKTIEKMLPIMIIRLVRLKRA